MMFWFHRYFISTNWRQLCELRMEFWTLEHDCEPKIVKQMQSVSTTPSKAENSDDDADGDPWDLRIPSLLLHSLFSIVIKQGKKLLTLFKHFDWILEQATLKYFCCQTSYDLFYDNFLCFSLTHTKIICWIFTSRDDTEEEKTQHIDNIYCHHKCRRKSSLICFSCFQNWLWGVFTLD